jgi:hypothetical protein
LNVVVQSLKHTINICWKRIALTVFDMESIVLTSRMKNIITRSGGRNEVVRTLAITTKQREVNHVNAGSKAPADFGRG